MSGHKECERRYSASYVSRRDCGCHSCCPPPPAPFAVAYPIRRLVRAASLSGEPRVIERARKGLEIVHGEIECLEYELTRPTLGPKHVATKRGKCLACERAVEPGDRIVQSERPRVAIHAACVGWKLW